MAGGTVDVGTLRGKLEMDTARATRSMNQFATGMQKQGQAMARVGGRMTKSLSLPLAAAGVASVKMAADFDDSFAKIEGLVGESGAALDEMRDDVLGLAGDTAKSPQELADALFFVESAGLRGQDAMAALESSAKASAAGLGDTQTVAKTVTGALESYKSAGLGASDATDILTATVRAGNLETSDLAGSLSRVLPIASQAGVGFDELGGAVALISRTGAPASEIITGLKAAMLALNAPTDEAQNALSDAGLSAETLRSTLADQGLIAAMEMVEQAAAGDASVMRKLLGSSEALNAANVLLGASNKDIAATFGVTEDAAGLTDEAFRVASQSAGFQFRRALADLQTTAIEVGDVLLPLASGTASGFSRAAGVFSDLPKPVKQSAVAFGLLVAGTGPALSVGGRLLENWGSLKRGAGRLTGSVRGLGRGFVGMNRSAQVAAVGGLAALAAGIAFAANEARKSEQAWNDAADAFVQGDAAAIQAAQSVFDSAGSFGVAAAGATKMAEEINEANARLGEAGVVAGQLATKQKALNDAVAEFGADSKQAKAAAKEMADAQEEQTRVTEGSEQALKAAGGEVDEFAGKLEDSASAANAWQQDVSEAVAKALDPSAFSDKAQKSLGAFKAELQKNIADMRAWRETVSELSAAGFDNLAAQAARMGPEFNAPFREALDGPRSDLVGLDQQVKELDRLSAFPEIGADTSAAVRNVDDAQRKLRQFDRMSANATVGVRDFASGRIRTINQALNFLNTRFVAPTISAFGGRRAHGGPVARNTPYLVGERGPEMFVPSVSGDIVSNANLSRGGMSGGGGGDTHVTIDLTGSVISTDREMERLADQIAGAMNRKNTGLLKSKVIVN